MAPRSASRPFLPPFLPSPLCLSLSPWPSAGHWGLGTGDWGRGDDWAHNPSRWLPGFLGDRRTHSHPLSSMRGAWGYGSTAPAQHLAGLPRLCPDLTASPHSFMGHGSSFRFTGKGAKEKPVAQGHRALGATEIFSLQFNSARVFQSCHRARLVAGDTCAIQAHPGTLSEQTRYECSWN